MNGGPWKVRKCNCKQKGCVHWQVYSKERIPLTKELAIACAKLMNDLYRKQHGRKRKVD